MKKQIVTIMLGAVVLLGTATALFAKPINDVSYGCDVFHVDLLCITDIALIQTAGPPDQHDYLVAAWSLGFRVGRLQTALFEALDNNAQRALP